MEPGRSDLPRHLSERLPADLRDALQHPVRRQILRTFSADVQKLTPSDLPGLGTVPCSAPCASYHMGILSGSNLIEEEASEPAAGSIRRYFSSAIGGKEDVLGVLRETEDGDRRIFAPAAPK